MMINRRLRSPKKALSAQKGTVLVEFALFLPILVFIMFASFAYTYILRVQQDLAAFASAAASEAARECGGITEFTCDADVTKSDCLKGVFDRMDALMRSVSTVEIGIGAFQLEKIAMTLSVYGQDAGDPSILELGGIYPEEHLNDCDPDSPAFLECCEQAILSPEFTTCSRFSETSFYEDSVLKDLLEAKGSGVIAEVHARYNLIGTNFLPKNLIEPLSRYYYVVVQ